MKVNLAENIKNLRKEKNVSQEKLADYLNISFQAVSKWETGNACPDISLLPDIARFFGITVDELLQVEKLDEERLFQEYEEKAKALFRDGKRREVLELTQEIYRQLPNNIAVKEYLMSSYYDMDKVKYRDEIINLGTEIYNSDAKMYYKGQAIREIANTYAENGNYEMAKKWVQKSYQIQHSRDVLYTEIDEGQDLIEDVSFCTYWFLRSLYYMACRITGCDKVERDDLYRKEALEKVAAIFEIMYCNDDMSYETLVQLCYLHIMIAGYEAKAAREDAARTHLLRALDCALKGPGITEHCLTSPLIDTRHIDAAPDNNGQIICLLAKNLNDPDFDPYRNRDWFAEILKQVK